jgi:hypothetical protein
MRCGFNRGLYPFTVFGFESIFNKKIENLLPQLDKPILTVVVNPNADGSEKGLIRIDFTSVPNAGSYKIYVNGTLVSIQGTNTSFDYTAIKNGTYIISVKAYPIDKTQYRASKKAIQTVLITDLGIYLATSGLKHILLNLKKWFVREP